MKNKIIHGEHPIWESFVVQPDYDHIRPELAARTTFEKLAADLGYVDAYKKVVQQLRRRNGVFDRRGRPIQPELVLRRVHEAGLSRDFESWGAGRMPRAAVTLAGLVNNDDLSAGITEAFLSEGRRRGSRENLPFIDLSGLELLNVA